MTEQNHRPFANTKSRRHILQGWVLLNQLSSVIGLKKITITSFHVPLIIIVLLLGIFVRIWEFGSLPPGLNQDEASSGVEAYSLYRFGVDRNGVSYPVQFISWGSGMHALYAYVLIPFVALGGLNPIMVRLPILLSGILTMPLVYFVAKQTLGKTFALISMFLLAISPWHIVQSRWGHEANSLPFIFLIGYACLLKSTVSNKWFITANLFFGLCLYAYGTAYAAVPVFLVCAVPILLRSKRVSIRNLIIGLCIFAFVSIPIGLFLLVNTLQLSPIQLGLFTIPRLPSQPRYESVTAIFNDNLFQTITQNLLNMFKLLLEQTDGLVWNTVEPYGYFYTITLPLAILGAAWLVCKSDKLPEQTLLLCWLVASLTIGVLLTVNINRINLIFIPLILCIAISLAWLGERLMVGLVIVICVLCISFVVFTHDYHGEKYRQRADDAFFAGLLPALNYVRQAGDNPICVTESVNMPYIFVLFSEQMNPSDYLGDIEYVDPTASFRKVRSLGRYTFGVQNCINDRRTIYILSGEQPPDNGVNYKIKSYKNYHVYSP